MKYEFFQACYAHPDTGWAVINTSENIPQRLVEDFSSIERANAAMAAGERVPMGGNETPTCMLEIYCRNDAIGLVRTQYGLSDGQGRPVSFSHGYIIPGAYEFLKEPNDLLRIKKENFADQRISKEERAEICSTPGAFNCELIRLSDLDGIPDEFLVGESYSYQSALEKCNLSEEAYRTYIMVLYAHLFSTNTEKNLYIKTDGSEKYAWNLLYLTYLAIPYSMRILLSASTYVHARQHNAKLIFCYELPDGAPQIDPVTGSNNIMNETLEKRMRERNPFIKVSLDYVVCGKQDYFFKVIEDCLRLMGDEKLNTVQVMNLAYSIGKKEYNIAERLPGLVYSWLTLPVKNTANWENTVCFLLKKAEEYTTDLGEEVKNLLQSRLENAMTKNFKAQVSNYLALADRRR